MPHIRTYINIQHTHKQTDTLTCINTHTHTHTARQSRTQTRTADRQSLTHRQSHTQTVTQSPDSHTHRQSHTHAHTQTDSHKERDSTHTHTDSHTCTNIYRYRHFNQSHINSNRANLEIWEPKNQPQLSGQSSAAISALGVGVVETVRLATSVGNRHSDTSKPASITR